MDYTKINGDLKPGETFRLGATNYMVRFSVGGAVGGGGVYAEPTEGMVYDSLPESPECFNYDVLNFQATRITRVIRARNED